MRRILTSVFGLALAVLFVGTFMAAPVRAEEKASAVVGQPAPNFELTDTAGKTHQLSDYTGKILVIHFQAIRCPWDRAYQPILNKLAEQYKDKNVVFLGINANRSDPMDQLTKDVAKKQIPYPVVKDPGSKIADAYGAHTTPHMYIIDAKGVLRYKGGVETPVANPDAIGSGKEQYVVEALDAMTQGKEPPKPETRSIGCAIKR